MANEPEPSSIDFLDALKQYMDSGEFQDALKRADVAAKEFAQKVPVLAMLAQALGTRLDVSKVQEYFRQLAESFAEGQRWADEAPQKLAAALAEEGLVPHPRSLSLDDVRELTDIFDEKGSRATAVRLNELHEELLGSVGFRAEMRARWEPRGRWQVISEVLAAFDAKLYAAAIPPALAQAEGVVAHLFGLKGMKAPVFKQNVAKLHEEDFDLFGPLARKVLDGLLGEFEHGEPVALLNRNAVMHGADSTYGTRENAIAAIIWADYIMCAASDYKAIAIPRRADD